MPHHEDNNFSAPPEEHEYAALLFDMDGTIIDSTDAIVKYWRRLGKEIGVDGDCKFKTTLPSPRAVQYLIALRHSGDISWPEKRRRSCDTLSRAGKLGL